MFKDLIESQSLDGTISQLRIALNDAAANETYDHPQNCCEECSSSMPVRKHGAREILCESVFKRVKNYTTAQSFRLEVSHTPHPNHFDVPCLEFLVWFGSSPKNITHGTRWYFCKSGKKFLACGPEDWEDTLEDVREEAEQIPRLTSYLEGLRDVNRWHEEKTGRKLFNLTDEVLSAISQPANDIAGFQRFVRAIRALVQEGLTKYESLREEARDFSNDLESLLKMCEDPARSDVSDKGTQDTRVRKRYLGNKNLADCSSEDLLVAQANVHEELAMFLLGLYALLE